MSQWILRSHFLQTALKSNHKTGQRSGPARQTTVWQFLLLTLVLSGCSTRQELPDGPTQPTNFPEQFYLSASSDPEKFIYKLDGDLSQIVLRVYRGGVMARLGHDHVITSQNVQGYIALSKNDDQCRADIFVPLLMLNVDDPQQRAAAELDTTPSTKDIADTKSNMLTSIDAVNFPFAQLSSEDCSGGLSGDIIPVVLTFHGVSRQLDLQIDLKSIADDQLVIGGEFSIYQTDFGIEPFSVMGGLITVEDNVDFTYRLTAQRITP